MDRVFTCISVRITGNIENKTGLLACILKMFFTTVVFRYVKCKFGECSLHPAKFFTYNKYVLLTFHCQSGMHCVRTL